MCVRILLVEDHAIVRSGLRLLLESAPALKVVAEVGDGRQAVEICQELRPDIVLTDVEMASLNGIEAARQIHASLQEIKIIMLSMHNDPKYVHESFKAGACGYVLKGASSTELLEAIHVVMSGKRYLSPQLTDKLVENPVVDPNGSGPGTPMDKLSGREREILQLVAEGRSSLEVARMIHVSARTVEFHRANVMQKLGIHTIAGLTRFAIKHGMTSAG